MASINPYLTLDGNCAEAFDFYKSVFGGNFANRTQFKDVPAETPGSDADGEKIMHVALPIGSTILMGSDRGPGHAANVTGNNFSVSFNADSEDQATKIFNGLAEGATITFPLQKTFWNAYFGMLTDKFGIQWLVNFDYN